MLQSWDNLSCNRIICHAKFASFLKPHTDIISENNSASLSLRLSASLRLSIDILHKTQK